MRISDKLYLQHQLNQENIGRNLITLRILLKLMQIIQMNEQTPNEDLICLYEMDC